MENRIASSCRQRGISIEEFDGFLTTENSRIRNSSKYFDWRDDVFKRDNYTCQCCGQVGGKLNAHHKKFQSTPPQGERLQTYTKK